MIIHKMCQECKLCMDGRCDGKTEDEVVIGKKPCKKYEFDFSLLEEEEEAGKVVAKELDTPGIDIKPEIEQEPIDIAETIKNESKHERFKRLSHKRLFVTLDNIRKLVNLTNKANYKWEEKDAEHIITALRKAITKLETKLY